MITKFSIQASYRPNKKKAWQAQSLRPSKHPKLRIEMKNQTAAKIEESRIEPSTTASAPAAGWRKYINNLIATELSSLSRYFDRTIQWKRRAEDPGHLLYALECNKKAEAQSIEALRAIPRGNETLILINGNINHDFNIEGTLRTLRPNLRRCDRITIVAYNPYLKPIYQLANALGIRKGKVPETFVTCTDINNMAKLAGFEIVRARNCAYSPWKMLGLGDFINTALPAIPLIRHLSLTSVITLRPLEQSPSKPSLSVVIPARNERGNIENALIMLDELRDIDLEIIFVEGHSNDGTWEEIERVSKAYADKYAIKCFKQTGKGKADAVRLGFAHADKDLLTILDADLTMPPERLRSFYDAYCSGKADFVNGSRLVYPMEGQAMRPLNHLGNIFFAKALSFVLGASIGDSLCGTKLLSRRDYDRFCKWRADFGDFDPFGDFELLFPAAQLGLGIVDVPIRYKDRTYGSTNISRFRHGIMLLKMTAVGLFRLKLGRLPHVS